jgi:hypothetical protein
VAIAASPWASGYDPCLAEQSPIEQVLQAVENRDLDALVGLLAPEVSLLTADGRRAQGREAARELLTRFLGELRSSSHRVTGQWHVDDMWIAETDASYELRDWLKIEDLPRAFIARISPAGIADLRVYGAHEQPLTDHPTGEEGMWIGTRWIPPL